MTLVGSPALTIWSRLRLRRGRPTSGALTALLVAAIAVAWWSTLRISPTMTSMVEGLAQVGRAMPFDMGVLAFLAAWIPMMAAMMLPLIVVPVLVSGPDDRGPARDLAHSVAFAGGYLTVWTSAGGLAWAALVALSRVPAGSTWPTRAAGLILLGAGTFQFTPLKRTCLRTCRLAATTATVAGGHGPIPGLHAGLRHGLSCLGACWALMAVLLAVGLMDVGWMVALTGVLVIERLAPHGVGLGRLAGAAILGLGIGVVVDPHLLASVS
jgi:predicted metal-binding membrane protein